MEAKKFDLTCPNENNFNRCEHLWKMARILITSDSSCENTIKIDVNDLINNNLYTDAFKTAMQIIIHKRFTEDQKMLLTQMIEQNTANIAEITTFLKMKNKTEFAQFLQSAAAVDRFGS